VPACLRTLEARSQVEARALIERRPDARARALGAFLISVTGFFRDASIFDQVQRVVIPSLAARAGMLRAWSAGCANGSELYSLAVLLAEAGLLTRTELVGTDCRPEALREARDAVFDAVAVERLDRARLARFFDRMPAARWRAAALLRAHASWRSGDITRGVEPGSWDVILWRNVAIYLRPEPALAIARRLVAALAPGGFLVLGRAERLPSGLGVRRVGRSLYQQVGCEHVA
jgi:chemotaxis methyl-accepting protein methylase